MKRLEPFFEKAKKAVRPISEQARNTAEEQKKKGVRVHMRPVKGGTVQR